MDNPLSLPQPLLVDCSLEKYFFAEISQNYFSQKIIQFNEAIKAFKRFFFFFLSLLKFSILQDRGIQRYNDTGCSKRSCERLWLFSTKKTVLDLMFTLRVVRPNSDTLP